MNMIIMDMDTRGINLTRDVDTKVMDMGMMNTKAMDMGMMTTKFMDIVDIKAMDMDMMNTKDMAKKSQIWTQESWIQT